jgi:hypothetical protein
MNLISLLIFIVIVCVVGALIFWALREAGLADPWSKIARVAIVVVAVLLIVGAIFGQVSVPWIAVR